MLSGHIRFIVLHRAKKTNLPVCDLLDWVTESVKMEPKLQVSRFLVKLLRDSFQIYLEPGKFPPLTECEEYQNQWLRKCSVNCPMHEIVLFLRLMASDQRSKVIIILCLTKTFGKKPGIVAAQNNSPLKLDLY